MPDTKDRDYTGCNPNVVGREKDAEIERLRARVAELEGALRDVLDSPRDGNHGKRVQGARSVLSGTPSERVAQRSEQAAHNGTVAGSTPAAFTTSDGWHDISTAPKDGTEILAWDGDYVIVRADPNGGWSDDFQQYLRLDKWMPLPAPPMLEAPINAVPKPEGE
jgi:hypothetical protein